MVKKLFKELAFKWLKAAKHDLDWAQGSMKLKKFGSVFFVPASS